MTRRCCGSTCGCRFSCGPAIRRRRGTTCIATEIACYVEDWGRYGDDGLLAVDDTTGADLGAAWLRLWPGMETGYGFVDRSTPELAIAVRPEHRGRGIGTCLLDALLDRASQRHRAVSLSVSLDNPAVALYQRHGFRAIAESSGTLTMRYTFPR